jgi:hypothetical protein
MHVLVRKDLPWSHKVVQAAHAVAEYIQQYSAHGWNQHLVIHRVQNEDELMNYYGRLKLDLVENALFVEPDMDHEATALAFLGNDDIVKDVPLL